jgi:hypothetical protein
LEYAATPANERNDLDFAREMTEQMIGDRLQGEVNRTLLYQLWGAETAIAAKNALRILANQRGPAAAASSDVIKATISTSPGKMSAVTITNTGTKTLYHCLIFTTLKMDSARITAERNAEDLFGVLVSTAFGLSQQTIKGSIEAGKLQTRLSVLDKGVVFYVAALPPGASVTGTLAPSGFYLMAKRASVSLWSDTVAVDKQPISNWKAVLAALQPPAPPKGFSSSRSWFGFRFGKPDPHQIPEPVTPAETFNVFISSDSDGPGSMAMNSYLERFMNSHSAAHVKLFSAEDQGGVIAFIRGQAKRTRINLIGHGQGGYVAAGLAANWQDLFGVTQSLQLLITADPVGRMTMADYQSVRNHVPSWVTVEAVPDELNAEDRAVWSSGRWRAEPANYCTAYVKAMHAHVNDLTTMMTSRGAGGRQMSPEAVLLSNP